MQLAPLVLVIHISLHTENMNLSLNPIQAGGRGEGRIASPKLDLFVNNFFIVVGIDLKFSVDSKLFFSDHMNFFRDRSGSKGGQDMGSKVRGGHPKLPIFDQNR